MLYSTRLSYFFIKSFFFKHIINELSLFFYSFKLYSKYKIVSFPYKVKKFTVVKSPFVSKLSREQFEIRTYKSLLIIYNIESYTFNSKKFNTISKYFKNTYIFNRLKILCL